MYQYLALMAIGEPPLWHFPNSRQNAIGVVQPPLWPIFIPFLTNHISIKNKFLDKPHIPTRSNIPELWNLHSFFSKNKNSEKYFHFSSTHSNSVYSLGHFQPICTQSKMLHSSYNLYQLVSDNRNYLRDKRCSKKLVLRSVKKLFTLRPPHTKICLITTFNRLVKSNQHVSSKQQPTK